MKAFMLEQDEDIIAIFVLNDNDDLIRTFIKDDGRSHYNAVASVKPESLTEFIENVEQQIADGSLDLKEVEPYTIKTYGFTEIIEKFKKKGA